MLISLFCKKRNILNKLSNFSNSAYHLEIQKCSKYFLSNAFFCYCGVVAASANLEGISHLTWIAQNLIRGQFLHNKMFRNLLKNRCIISFINNWKERDALHRRMVGLSGNEKVRNSNSEKRKRNFGLFSYQPLPLQSRHVTPPVPRHLWQDFVLAVLGTCQKRIRLN